MLTAVTELKHAEKVKKFIIKKGILNYNYKPIKELKYLYFPITKKIKIPHATVKQTKLKYPQKQQTLTITQLLEKKLTKNQLKLLPRSQETVGSIMILEVPDKLEKKEKIIAEAYLKLNKNITTVVKKTKMHSGVFRTRKVKILAGKKTKETIHHENGIRIKLHLEKTYFSARSGNERLRLAKQVKKNEQILVMFSGAAPFPLVLAKNSPASKVYGIELNPAAHEYARHNIDLNKLQSKVVIHHDDVRKILPKLRKKFDRIAMPLPKTSEEFLDVALPKGKPGTIVHLYAFLNEKDIDNEAKKVKKICKDLKHPVRVLRKVKCGQFSPGTFRVCFDLKMLK